MKKGSVFIFILIAFNLILVSFIGGPIAFALLYISLLLPVLSLVYVFYVRKNIELRQSHKESILVVNAVNTYIIKIINNTSLPFVNLSFQFIDNCVNLEKIQLSKRITVMPMEENSISLSMYFLQRGTYEIGIKKIIITDLFGIIKISLKPKDKFLVRVYPSVYQISSLPFVIGSIATGQQSFKNSRTADVPDVEIRQYQTGDPLKTVNWKASARKHELYAKKFVELTNKKVTIIMDIYNYTNDEKFKEADDKIISTTVSLIKYLVDQNIVCNLKFYNNNNISECEISSDNKFMEFYSITPELESNTKCPAKMIITNSKFDKKNSGEFIIITQQLDIDLYKACIDLISSGITVVVMIVDNIVADGIDCKSDLKVLKIDNDFQNNNALIFR